MAVGVMRTCCLCDVSDVYSKEDSDREAIKLVV